MKFLTFAIMDVAKAAEVAKAADKVWASPPPGVKLLASYVCQGLAFPGVPPHTVVSIRVVVGPSGHRQQEPQGQGRSDPHRPASRTITSVTCFAIWASITCNAASSADASSVVRSSEVRRRARFGLSSGSGSVR